MRALIDFGAPGRAAGLALLAMAFALTAAGPSAAKDVPGRKRCFVAGIETFKEEPVYRDKSSGYQRVQVPGSKGERCFWEPLDYQEAAAAAPVRPSRAAPSTAGRRSRIAKVEPAARTAKRAENKPSPSDGKRPAEAPANKPAEPPAQKAAPAEPQRLAALPPQRSSQPAPRPEPQPAPNSRPRAEPAPPPQPAPQPQRQAQVPPEPVAPVLQPRGLTSGSASGGVSPDLRIRTRPVASGGTVSTVSSGPGIDALIKEDQVVPEVEEDAPEPPGAPSAGEPMPLPGARTALAALTPRTSVRGRRTQPPAAADPKPAKRPEPAARQASASARAATPASASNGEGTHFVQLGSVTSYQKAKQFWTDVTGRYSEPLAPFSPDILEADIPGKGIYYRVRVGPMGKNDAKALCKRLEGNCLVVAR